MTKHFEQLYINKKYEHNKEYYNNSSKTFIKQRKIDIRPPGNICNHKASCREQLYCLDE